MNNEIPTIWLWISGIFFVLGAALFAATIVVLYKILQMSKDLKPRVEALTLRVETLMVKIDRVTDSVDATMVSVKASVDGVGGKAQGIMGSVETVVRGTSSRLEGITPIIAGALAAYKIFMSLKAAHDKSKANPTTKALPAKKK